MKERWDVLNAYAGIGGNRKDWENVNVTAVEIDEEIAAIYRDHFPEDTVIIGDAHEFIRDNFHEFDIIWSSPPCPTHSHVRNVANVGRGQSEPVYPDMDLYEEIIFLRQARRGSWRGWRGEFVVENVQSYYDPLIRPQEVGRHYLWASFAVPSVDIPPKRADEMREAQQWMGFDLRGYDMDARKKGTLLKNAVYPDLGRAVLDAARRGERQKTFREM